MNYYFIGVVFLSLWMVKKLGDVKDPIVIKQEVPILKEKKKSKKKKKILPKFKYAENIQILNIKSINRDYSVNPDANYFTYKLDIPIRNVKYLELMRFKTFGGIYTIDNHNNVMEITSQSNYYLIKVPIGNYNIKEYIAELNSQFADKAIGLEILYDKITSKVTITNLAFGIEYNILWFSGAYSEYSNFHELGFEKNDITITDSKTSDFRVNISNNHSIDIFVKDFQWNYGDDKLASIKKDQSGIYVFDNTCISSKRRIDPLRKVSRLTFEIMFNVHKKDPRRYNFNGLEYEMDLEVTTWDSQLLF